MQRIASVAIIGIALLATAAVTLTAVFAQSDESVSKDLQDGAKGPILQVFEGLVVTELWRQRYNQRRPHSALGYRPPAPAAILTSTRLAPEGAD